MERVERRPIGVERLYIATRVQHNTEGAHLASSSRRTPAVGFDDMINLPVYLGMVHETTI